MKVYSAEEIMQFDDGEDKFLRLETVIDLLKEIKTCSDNIDGIIRILECHIDCSEQD